MFGETVDLRPAARARPTDPDARLALLAESLEGQIATVFRQIAMNRFEDAVHTARREEGELSRRRLRRALGRDPDAMLGDAVEITEGYRTWWSLHPALHRHARLRVRLRLRPAARAVGVPPATRSEGDGVRARVPRAAAPPAARRRPRSSGGSSASTSPTRGFWDGGLDIIDEQLAAAEAAAREAGRLCAGRPRSASGA